MSGLSTTRNTPLGCVVMRATVHSRLPRRVLSSPVALPAFTAERRCSEPLQKKSVKFNVGGGQRHKDRWRPHKGTRGIRVILYAKDDSFCATALADELPIEGILAVEHDIVPFDWAVCSSRE